MRKNRSGFTLVELLVVIGIIGILIAVLLPSLVKAQQAANRISCASNLRQVGIAMANYVARYRNYPVPTGQPGFNRNLTDWNYCRHRNDALLPAPALAGTPTEIYLFGTGAWWVGMITQDPLWYRQKAFQCTTTAVSWAESFGARHPQYWNNTGYGELTSNVGGVVTFNPIQNDGVKSPWYTYMHPFVSDYHVLNDWWDAQHAGTDWKKLLFASDANRYRVGPSNQMVGPRLKHQRRPQFACPTVATFPPPFWFRNVFEPHGKGEFAGTQNSRAPKDPEDRNYLYTDGSVLAVRR